MTDETKYGKLQTALKSELASGRFRPGDRFYTEREIMEKYHVSGITVARALSKMTEHGYFERKRKLGTFVKESPEMPGMTGGVMTRPLYLNRVVAEDLESTRSGPSWFVVEEIRRGIINSYPGAVKIIDMDEIMAEAEKDPALPVIVLPQQIALYDQKYAPCKPINTIEIILPPGAGNACNCIRPNYLVGVYEALEHLIRIGHHRIAFLGRPELKNRYAAYRIAMEVYGIVIHPEYVILDDRATGIADGMEMLEKLLALPEKPTAVFCATDKLAFGVMQAAEERHLKIPEDLSLIGFDDTPLAANCKIPLSTVNVPYYELGKAAVELLFEKIKTARDVPARTLMTKYVMRQTVAKYKESQFI